MKQLTEKQKKVFDYIVERTKKNFPPTLKEISDNFNLSITGIRDYINSLKKKGYIKNNYKKARSLYPNLIELEFSKSGKHLYIIIGVK